MRNDVTRLSSVLSIPYQPDPVLSWALLALCEYMEGTAGSGQEKRAAVAQDEESNDFSRHNATNRRNIDVRTATPFPKTPNRQENKETVGTFSKFVFGPHGSPPMITPYLQTSPKCT